MLLLNCYLLFLILPHRFWAHIWKSKGKIWDTCHLWFWRQHLGLWHEFQRQNLWSSPPPDRLIWKCPPEDLGMNYKNNSWTRSIFSDHLTLGLGRLLVSRAAQPRQKFQECPLPPGGSTVREEGSTARGEGLTWSQLCRQNLGQRDQIRLKSSGGLQTRQTELGKNPEAESNPEFYSELECQIN